MNGESSFECEMDRIEVVIDGCDLIRGPDDVSGMAQRIKDLQAIYRSNNKRKGVDSTGTYLASSGEIQRMPMQEEHLTKLIIRKTFKGDSK